LLIWAGDLHTAPGEAAAKRLRDDIAHAATARLDSVVIPAFRGGTPLFASEICRDLGGIRRYPWERRKWRGAPTPFDMASAACREEGLRPWGQIELFTAGAREPDAYSIAAHRPRWMVRNAQGRPSPIAGDHEHLFLCPTHPDVPRLLAELAGEIVRAFPVTALVLDIRSAPCITSNRDALCLCFHCQEAASRDLGLDLLEVLEAGTEEHWREWRYWRETTYASLIERMRAYLWSARPGIPLALRVDCPEEPQRPAYSIGGAFPGGGAVAGEQQSAPEPPSSSSGGEQSVPFWVRWIRERLVEMVLMDAPVGAPADSERRLIQAISGLAEYDCFAIPLFTDKPVFHQEDSLDRAAAMHLPGWGLKRHLLELWDETLPLRPARSEAGASAAARQILEENPLQACLEAFDAALPAFQAPALASELAAIRQSLLEPSEALSAEDLETLGMRLATTLALIQQESDPELRLAAPRGWLEIALRLLHWHTALHCRELYQFDAS